MSISSKMNTSSQVLFSASGSCGNWDDDYVRLALCREANTTAARYSISIQTALGRRVQASAMDSAARARSSFPCELIIATRRRASPRLTVG